jgi:hypothetical protein
LGVYHGSNLLVLGIGCVSVEALAVGEGLLMAKVFDHITGIS